MRRYRKPTIKDVAARAGVSTTTVSVFANGREDVCSPETAERIRAAIAALRYTPNSLSRGLRVPATRTLGVCIGASGGLRRDPRNSFLERTWRGISDAADAENYSLLHYPTSVRNAESCHAFLDGRVDGLLFSAPHDDTRPAALANAGMPIVVLTRFLDLPASCGAVYADENDTVRRALSHLWELGHRRIAHLAGPVGSSDIALCRRDSYVAWLKARSAYDPALLAPGQSWSNKNAAQAVAPWRRLPQPPTAVFCANDQLAVGVIAAAGALGWRVPGGLSVVGVDNQATAGESDPPLTSVDIPAEEIGWRAVGALLHLIGGAPVEECRVALPVTQLAVRSSTAPPPV